MAIYEGGRQQIGSFVDDALAIAKAAAAPKPAAGVSSFGRSTAVSSFGRTAVDAGPVDICALAASARARGSVAATSLEAQCAAFRARAPLTQAAGSAAEEGGGIPRAVLIAGGVVAVLGVAALVFKLTR